MGLITKTSGIAYDKSKEEFEFIIFFFFLDLFSTLSVAKIFSSSVFERYKNRKKEASIKRYYLFVR